MGVSGSRNRKKRAKKSVRVKDSRERVGGVRYLLQELLEVPGGDTATAAQERAVVTAQLLLVPEAKMQPVARHIQVLGAEAGAAAEAPRGGRRHGEAAAPASVAVLPYTSPLRAWRRQSRGR